MMMTFLNYKFFTDSVTQSIN